VVIDVDVDASRICTLAEPLEKHSFLSRKSPLPQCLELRFQNGTAVPPNLITF
jgi:hypothetical protein